GAGFEGDLAVRGSGGDQHDALPWFESAVTVDDEDGLERPAALRLGLDLRQLLFGHARIMLERHGADGAAACHIPDQPDEADDATDVLAAGRKPRQFDADIEVLALYPDHGLSRPSPAETAPPRRWASPESRGWHTPGLRQPGRSTGWRERPHTWA